MLDTCTSTNVPNTRNHISPVAVIPHISHIPPITWYESMAGLASKKFQWCQWSKSPYPRRVRLWMGIAANWHDDPAKQCSQLVERIKTA